MYNLNNLYITNPVKKDKVIINDYVSDNMKKIINENKLFISQNNKISFLSDINTYYKDFVNNILLLNLGIDIDKNYEYIKSKNINKHNKYNFINQKNNNIFDKLSFYKITNLYIKKYGFG